VAVLARCGGRLSGVAGAGFGWRLGPECQAGIERHAGPTGAGAAPAPLAEV